MAICGAGEHWKRAGDGQGEGSEFDHVGVGFRFNIVLRWWFDGFCAAVLVVVWIAEYVVDLLSSLGVSPFIDFIMKLEYGHVFRHHIKSLAFHALSQLTVLPSQSTDDIRS